MKTFFKNYANHFAMLLMALAMSLAFLACEEKSKKAEAGTFTDARDGKVYKTVKIGEQVWMAENLNFKTEKSRCYGDDEANCKKYGRLYTLETAMKACPNGWHLPDNTEWGNLMVAVGGARKYKEPYENSDGYFYYDVAGKKLKSKTGWNDNDGKNGNGTDEFGFSALPDGGGYSGSWWSSTIETHNNESEPFYQNMSNSGDYVNELYIARCDCDGDNDVRRFSVRCVQGDSGTASKASVPPSTDTDYSPALQTHYSKGTLGESGKTRPIEMFFQKVSKNGGSYSISGKSKTNAAEDAFSGTLSISSQTAGGSCNSRETELKGSYDLNEKESKTSGHFVGTFIACETSGKLSKANFKGNWVKHANGNKTPCDFGI